MLKKIVLKLKSIKYSGDSVGYDIHLEIRVQNKVYNLDKSIKPGSVLKVNEEIAQLEMSANSQEEDIIIKMVEKDLIFNDTSKVSRKIKINTDSKEPQEFEFEVKVQEMRATLRKSTAVFTITLEAGQLKSIPSVEDPKWTGDFNDDTEQMILARMIFGEVENQSKKAKIGVGFTVLNRIKKQRTNWGFTIHEVILKESQYDSLWNKDTKDKVRNPLQDIINQGPWSESYEAAGTVLSRQIADPTFGATNFHSYKHQKDFPWWATENNFKVKINKIYFYELER